MLNEEFWIAISFILLFIYLFPKLSTSINFFLNNQISSIKTELSLIEKNNVEAKANLDQVLSELTEAKIHYEQIIAKTIATLDVIKEKKTAFYTNLLEHQKSELYLYLKKSKHQFLSNL